ncbi:MAG: hypothetical protein IJE21_05625 [Alistipes sp.]|nr:hypothetical protein [Alistipes sp.]
MKLKLILIAIAAMAYVTADACSSAIIAPRASKEGGAILWKHRDQTKNPASRLEHFTDGTYSYTALVGAAIRSESVFAGLNSAGLGVINTNTHNLPIDKSDTTGYKSAGQIMRHALRECATVEEFEQILRTRKRSSAFQSNIGVADSTGAAAYFEVWGSGYKRYDVEQMKRGYDIRTNFSFAGSIEKRGTTERRHRSLEAQMEGKRTFESKDFFAYSRSYFSSDRGDVLLSERPYTCTNYTVPRSSSIACIVIVCGANPRMDVTIGHPVAGIQIPVWVESGNRLPKCIATREMFDLGHHFTQKAYTKSGKYYRVEKDVVLRALGVRTRFKYPKTMPADIDAFNAKADAAFAEHRKRMMKVL